MASRTSENPGGPSIVDIDVPAEVKTAFALDATPPRVIAMGWINRTLLVERAGEPVILQRLHPIFRGEVNLDIDVITAHLAKKGLETPRVIRAIDGALFVNADGVWRALTFIPGETLDALSSPALVFAAGAHLARFHRALADLEHAFAFTRPDAHDTAAHLEKLRALARSGPTAISAAYDGERVYGPRADELRTLTDEILAAGDALEIPHGLPLRIIHGDPKATNLLFDEQSLASGTPIVRTLVDLDTLQHGTIAVELGDALRSWSNPTSESDPDAAVDVALFAAAVEGYASASDGLLEREEIDAIVPGVETIAIELAARFAADVYEDRYFGWDASKYASRAEHNFARARAQLSLARSITARRAALTKTIVRTFS